MIRNFIFLIFFSVTYLDASDISSLVSNNPIQILSLIVFVFLLILILRLKNELKKESNKNIEYQKMLLQKNKQIELGKQVANISHQWRDSLSIINSINIELQTKLEYKIPINEEDIKIFTKDIESKVSFMSDTMNMFLEFYKDKSDYEEIYIKDTIESIIKILDIDDEKISIVINDNFSLRLVSKKSYWMNIWFCFITNSLNAAQKEGVEFVKIEIFINKNEIIYNDNCKGITKETQEKIKNDEHDGLGLKIIKDILLKHEWCMFCSNKDDGISFKLSDLELRENG